jgi:hypothetical protein
MYLLHFAYVVADPRIVDAVPGVGVQEQHASGNKLRYQLHYTLTVTG